MQINTLQTRNLHLQNWSLLPGQIWCVLGNNASGKSQLAAALCGEPLAGTVDIDPLPANPAWIGFETLQAQYEAELANDDTDFLDRQDHGTTGLELLLQTKATEQEATRHANTFGIAHLLDRGCRLFSSGELRRIQLLAEWLRQPDLLILDEPFEALDADARRDTYAFLEKIAANGQALLLLVNRLDDIAPWATHVALLRNGQLIHTGTRQDVLNSPACRQILSIAQNKSPKIPPTPLPATQASPDPLLQLKNGHVRYGDTYQFRDLDWTLRPGQHTLVTGPNGCGKSTLLALLTGDHPQCYVNDLHLFGYQRGTGESIWDIKRHIGYLSPSLHRDYRVSCTVQTAVLSGFHDSIGLYHPATAAQTAIARQWLALFKLTPFAQHPLHSLSYGQQRLALVARALVKQPPLVILDEPTQGLDDLNRHLLLAALDQLAQLKKTTLLFVSHRQDEHTALFKHQLQFQADPTGQARYRIVKLS